MQECWENIFLNKCNQSAQFIFHPSCSMQSLLYCVLAVSVIQEDTICILLYSNLYHLVTFVPHRFASPPPLPATYSQHMAKQIICKATVYEKKKKKTPVRVNVFLWTLR